MFFYSITEFGFNAGTLISYSWLRFAHINAYFGRSLNTNFTLFCENQQNLYLTLIPLIKTSARYLLMHVTQTL